MAELTRRYLSFDLETVKIVEDMSRWRDERPLGIGCVAAVASDLSEPLVWHGQTPDGDIALSLTQEAAAEVVRDLTRLVDDGYTLLAWNGLGFDLNVLSGESGLVAECQKLALAQVDPMFHFYRLKGFPIALDKAARACGIPGKTDGMDGSLANRMWQQVEFRRQVVDYCINDCQITLNLTQCCEQKGYIQWVTRRGGISLVFLPDGWLSVREALGLPDPDVSWMTQPIPLSDFVDLLEQ